MNRSKYDVIPYFKSCDCARPPRALQASALSIQSPRHQLNARFNFLPPFRAASHTLATERRASVRVISTMAILKGIKVWISSNGEDLQEIRGESDLVEANPDHEVTKYVEVIAGANFTVHTEAIESFARNNKQVKALSYTVSLDGIERVWKAPAGPKFSLKESTATSYRNNQAHERAFLFSEIERSWSLLFRYRESIS